MRSVRFAMPVGAPPPSSDALRRALRAGALVVGAGLSLTALPTARHAAPPAVELPSATEKASMITISSLPPAPLARAAAAPGPAQRAAREPSTLAAPITPRRAPLPASTPRFHVAPVARPVEPPVTVPAILTAPPVPPVAVTLPESPPLLAIAIPPAPPSATPASPVAEATRIAPSAAAPPRASAVQIEQLAATDAAPAYMQQLTPAGRDGLAPTHGLAFAADMSQLAAPAALSREQRAALLTEAPTQLSLVVDGRRLGEVAIRMADATTIEVQLAGLLDLLAPRFAAQEFAALRSAQAAGAYVSLAQLDAAGIDLDYDPVYDELTLSA